VSDADPRAVEAVLRLHAERPDAVLAIAGPTGTGKTALALAVAERLGGEVVSCDSVQIYRYFDLGSGKPTRVERARARHHLVDAADPLEAMDAARYAELAGAALADLRARGKVAVVCGGTFLWMKALLYGLVDAAPASPEVRARHRLLAEREGRASLHARLGEVDPRSAARLHPNDVVRVSRALEVHELTGRRMSELQEGHAFAQARHPAVIVALAREPGELTGRVSARARAWLDAGWIEETESLVKRGYGEARAMSSVGYREVHAFLEGSIARADLLGAVVRATRVFARRQRTWLRRADVTWL
jgi:tRNA dimethylallyltransferase